MALWAGILSGTVSLWLAPIALSLVLAVPLSALSGVKTVNRIRHWMATREEFTEPQITRAARAARADLKALLDGSTARGTPAE